MKYTLSLLIAGVMAAGTVSAQKVNFGVKAGANISTIKYDPDLDNGTKVGFHAGGLAHIHLAPQLALQPEVLYSMQGAKNNMLNGKTEFTLGYIAVPVMLQYMFDNGFRIEAGPQVSFLTSAKKEIANVETDIKKEINKADFGVGAGISYVMKSGFGIDARYNFGLNDISKDKIANPYKAYNRGAQIGLFYQFSHK
ncbi:MAG: hypothetical protein JWQ27_972 [Ferruginibacter sp.]|nr:hypothetical protein [Ferruginibacter sp.]